MPFKNQRYRNCIRFSIFGWRERYWATHRSNSICCNIIIVRTFFFEKPYDFSGNGFHPEHLEDAIRHIAKVKQPCFTDNRSGIEKATLKIVKEGYFNNPLEVLEAPFALLQNLIHTINFEETYKKYMFVLNKKPSPIKEWVKR